MKWPWSKPEDLGTGLLLDYAPPHTILPFPWYSRRVVVFLHGSVDSEMGGIEGAVLDTNHIGITLNVPNWGGEFFFPWQGIDYIKAAPSQEGE